MISTMAMGSQPVSGLCMANRQNRPAVRESGGCSHRKIVVGDVERVDELGKAQRSVGDRVQTTMSENETWCARVMNTSFKGHIICLT